ncbi:MAG: Protein of unknown function (DUF721) [Solidesulfovibrio magneticus str. Maddingley MBC34]|uniref:DUF721 domain-containing protein n=1 Tax=Solidesulfovibrio magneticus str. Maddingley MBC34 TaxID=1206767 RepID=K6GP60_9BACT|nr:MAG: Protein of unknown function (DUF721) [Solidesulfovibrio magneticus str. Maddingley MBC34]
MLRRLSESVERFMAVQEASARRNFVEVCRRWAEIVGPETAELLRPLGHKRRDLYLGADDPVALQEMVFAAPEILSLVNAALGHEAFDKVRFDLLGGRVPLDALRAIPPRFSTPAEVRPEGLGGLVGKLDPNSPVGRCYAKYVAYFESGPGSGSGGRRKARRAKRG